MGETTFDVYCPDCNVKVEAIEICRGSSAAERDLSVLVVDEVDRPIRVSSYSVLLCRRCQNPFLRREDFYEVPGEFETRTADVVLYPNQAGRLGEGIPAAVLRTYEQALRCYASSLFDASALMSRKCLESVCATLSAEGRTLHAKLDAMQRAAQIDGRLAEWAHGVRVIGNDAAHGTDQEVTQEDARDAIDFMEAVLTYVFVLNTRFEAFQKRREK